MSPSSSQVLQRIDDVSLMCDKRIISLKKMALKPPPRPVQTVTAIPLSSSANNNQRNNNTKPSNRVSSQNNRSRANAEWKTKARFVYTF